MKKIQKRWYEKNECLRAFLSVLEDLPEDVQSEIAVDMILRITELLDRDYSKVIGEVGDYNPKDFKRWYDKNPNIHLAIDSLRDLDEAQREEIVEEFSERLIDLKPINLDEEIESEQDQ